MCYIVSYKFVLYVSCMYSLLLGTCIVCCNFVYSGMEERLCRMPEFKQINQIKWFDILVLVLSHPYCLGVAGQYRLPGNTLLKCTVVYCSPLFGQSLHIPITEQITILRLLYYDASLSLLFHRDDDGQEQH